MKLPIVVTNTSYVEFDTPCYYKSPYDSYVKIYDTGYLKVSKEAIMNYNLESGFNQKYYVDEIRELLEKGTPITEAEFKEAMQFTYTHLNIIAS